MRLLCMVLLLTLFPLPAHAQEESLGDVARRERDRKQAPQRPVSRAADAEGFIWVGEAGHSARYAESRSPATTIEGCEASCLKQPDCKAYKLAPGKDGSGTTLNYCSVKRLIVEPTAVVGAVDSRGFTWVRKGTSAGSLTTGFRGAGEGTAEGCRNYCERSECLAYKFANEQFQGKYTTTCTRVLSEESPGGQGLDLVLDIMITQAALVKLTTPLPANLGNFSAAEKKALGHLLLTVIFEKTCHSMMGKFLTLAQLESTQCQDPSGFGVMGLGPIPADVTAELKDHSDYALNLDLTHDTPVVAAMPSKAGLAGFYYDGDKVHFQAASAATGTSASMGTEQEILKAIVDAQPKDDSQPQAATPASAAGAAATPSAATVARPASPPAKHVYTNDEIPSASPSSAAGNKDWSVTPVAFTDDDTDRPGFTTIRQPMGPLAEPAGCQLMCDQLSTCVAWVFHRAPSGPQCELKNVVTPAVQKAGYTSGVKAGARIPPSRPNP